MKRLVLASVMTIAMALAYGGNSGSVWVESTHADFVDGAYTQNLYAAQNGNIEFASRFDLNNDGYIDIFSSSSSAISIYWGSSQGYSTGNMISFPTNGTGGCEGADLNQDGWPEFVVSYGNGLDRIAIYWGTPNGYTPTNCCNIPLNVTNETIYIADLNKDGYLDIIGGTTIGYSTSSIYWGSSQGYSAGRRTDLPTVYGAHNFEVADLDGNGYLDIIAVNNNATYNYIYWGSAAGYSTASRTTLNLPGVAIPHGSTVADFNGDGWLDIVFTAVFSNTAYLFYGSASGYTTYQGLQPGSCYGGSSAVDFNADGYVDIVFFRGRSGGQPVVYWGSATGFSETNKMFFGSYISGTGGFIADLNGDHTLDVYIENYEGNSLIFWGPNYTSTFVIPTGGDHHAMFREAGNAFNRRYYEDYVSSVFDAGSVTDWRTAAWDAQTPAGSAVSLWVRGGNTPVPDYTWSAWSEVLNGGQIPGTLYVRYLQYQARLGYGSPAGLPQLQEVRISYGPGAGPLTAGVIIKPETINLKSHGVFTAFITPPVGYGPAEIDINTVQCVGCRVKSYEVTPVILTAKFNVDDIMGIAPGPAVEFLLTGQLTDGTPFSGVDTVNVIEPSTILVYSTPNPFAGRTTIMVSDAGSNIQLADAHCVVKIFNPAGMMIRAFEPGINPDRTFRVTWDRTDRQGRRVPAGMYFISVETGNARASEKLIVID